MRRLIANLSSEDARVATMSAGMILERAFGRPREAEREERQEAQLDVSQLNNAELQLLLRLVQSGRLCEAPVADPPPEIEGTKFTAGRQNE
jgi:hypothetical protein